MDDATIKAKLATRDLSIDFVRVFSIILVVVLHTMMVGLSIDSSGKVTQINPLEKLDWFPVASWFGQIMPLFFVAGGFAAWVGWDSVKRKGGTWKEYLRSRAIRLLYPVAIFYGIWLIGIGLAVHVFNVDLSLMEMFLAGIGMPLWFVVAYILCQIFTPIIVIAHKSKPFLTLTVLLTGVVIVDLLCWLFNQPLIGLVNLLFVWLFATQLGFFLAQPVFAPSKLLLIVGVIAGFGLTAVVVALNFYPADMLANLNPPKLPLVFIGVAWACLFTLLRPGIRQLMTLKPVQAVVFVIGSRAMTVYLWHLPVVVALSSLVLVAPNIIPSPGDEFFWLSRFLLLVPVFGIVLLISLVLARFETGPKVGATPKPSALLSGVIIGTVPSFVAMEISLSYSQIVWGFLFLWISIWLLIGKKSEKEKI